jgi:dTDP-4-amino-4,6-dideoxygalactose transaminase
MQIPMSSPDISEAEIAAVNAVLRTSYLSIGPQIEQFEVAMARRIGTGHAIGVNSGTSGLHLCVIAAGVQPGDFVVTTPFSFIASANAILYERAIPIFVDVDPVTGNISPEGVTAAVEGLSRGGEAAERWLPRALRGGQTAGMRDAGGGQL